VIERDTASDETLEAAIADAGQKRGIRRERPSESMRLQHTKKIKLSHLPHRQAALRKCGFGAYDLGIVQGA
jgi:hypothetical protein